MTAFFEEAEDGVRHGVVKLAGSRARARLGRRFNPDSAIQRETAAKKPETHCPLRKT